MFGLKLLMGNLSLTPEFSEIFRELGVMKKADDFRPYKMSNANKK